MCITMLHTEVYVIKHCNMVARHNYFCCKNQQVQILVNVIQWWSFCFCRNRPIEYFINQSSMLNDLDEIFISTILLSGHYIREINVSILKLTDATSRSSRERHEGVVMSIGRSFRQEIVGVKLVRIGVYVRSSMQLVCSHNDCRTRWDLLTVGR